MQIRKKLLISLAISFLILIVSFLISVSLGTVDVSLAKFFDILKNIPGKDGIDVDDRLRTIILQIRLPRVVLSILVGGGLSIVGVVMQSIFKNPMAEPGILGWSSGGAFFAVLIIYTELATGNAL